MLTDLAFEEIRKEWKAALPKIVAGKPDRTDLMMPLKRAQGGREFCTMADIIRLVSRETGIRPEKITGRDRTKLVCMARNIVFFVANEIRTYQSLGELGRMMNRDHTTVSNSLMNARNMRRRSASYKMACESVLDSLGRSTELA